MIERLRRVEGQNHVQEMNGNQNQQNNGENHISRQWDRSNLDNFILLLSDLGFENLQFFSTSRLPLREGLRIKRVTEEAMQRFMNDVTHNEDRELCYKYVRNLCQRWIINMSEN